MIASPQRAVDTQHRACARTGQRRQVDGGARRAKPQRLDVDQRVDFTAARNKERVEPARERLAAANQDRRRAGIGIARDIARARAAIQRVIAETALKRIIARAAEDVVVAQPADETVSAGAAAAIDQIVAVAAGDRFRRGVCADDRIVARVARDAVRAAACDDRVVAGTAGDRVGTREARK